MARTRIKVCGLCRRADSDAAVLAGADAVGVILAESPRRVTLDEAEAVLAGVPALVWKVGVFLDAPGDEVEEAVRRLGLTHVQFHGGESPEDCARAPVPVIKVLRVGPGFDPSAIEPYEGTVAAVLLDTYVPGVDGGTGRVFSWSEVLRIPPWARVVLAGGLTPDNVAGAVRKAHPFAVDVSSGVESRPREKDAAALERFCEAVRAADEEAT